MDSGAGSGSIPRSIYTIGMYLSFTEWREGRGAVEFK